MDSFCFVFLLSMSMAQHHTYRDREREREAAAHTKYRQTCSLLITQREKIKYLCLGIVPLRQCPETKRRNYNHNRKRVLQETLKNITNNTRPRSVAAHFTLHSSENQTRESSLLLMQALHTTATAPAKKKKKQAAEFVALQINGITRSYQTLITQRLVETARKP